MNEGRFFLWCPYRDFPHTFTRRKATHNMYEYSRDDMHRKMEVKTAIDEYEMEQSPALQEVYSKLQEAQRQAEKEQQKLDATPRIRNGKHNTGYGAQLNIRDAALARVEAAQQELTTAQNAFSRGRRLAKLDAQRQAEKDERDAPMLEQAEKKKAEWMANARTRWLAEGGSELLFQMKSEDMYADYIQKKMQGPDLVEQLKQKFRATGRYDI
jgi:hypothetical protein